MFAEVFISVLMVGLFLGDMGRRWWLQNEWKRRMRQTPSWD